MTIAARIRDAARQERAARARELDAATPELKRRGQHGKPRDTNNGTMFQDDASYAHARLRRDRPELHELVLAGELSAHAAMVQAGFRKARPSRRRSELPLDRIRKACERLDRWQWRELLTWVSRQHPL